MSVIRQRTVFEGGKIYNDWKQPGRREILKDNIRRQHQEAPRKSVGYAASFPKLDSEVMRKRLDEFRNDSRKLEKFLNSSEGRPYRVTPKRRARAFSFGGIGNGDPND